MGSSIGSLQQGDNRMAACCAKSVMHPKQQQQQVEQQQMYLSASSSDNMSPMAMYVCMWRVGALINVSRYLH
jgi:hypothetical protein